MKLIFKVENIILSGHFIDIMLENFNIYSFLFFPKFYLSFFFFNFFILLTNLYHVNNFYKTIA